MESCGLTQSHRSYLALGVKTLLVAYLIPREHKRGAMVFHRAVVESHQHITKRAPEHGYLAVWIGHTVEEGVGCLLGYLMTLGQQQATHQSVTPTRIRTSMSTPVSRWGRVPGRFCRCAL
eukprot:scaffold4958_cov406-Prasinococcus_capsulatus_cf.AAC.6